MTLDLNVNQRKRRSLRMALFNSYQAVYNRATPLQKSKYGPWYPTAHASCSLMAQRLNVETSTVCGVVAALSPGTRWEENLWSAWAALNGDWDTAWDYHTYGSLGIGRAKTIVQNDLTGQDAYKVISRGASWKTQAFYNSLLLMPNSACVDAWIYRINQLGYKSSSPTTLFVRQAQAAIRMLASKENRPSYEIQSILWGRSRFEQGKPAYQDTVSITQKLINAE